MKKIVRLTENDLVRLVKKVIKEQEESVQEQLTFGDKVKGKLGKVFGIPEITDDEKMLLKDILSKVENGEYEVLDTYAKGFKIKVPLDDGDYIVSAREQMVNFEASMLVTYITTPDGETVKIHASGFTNKLIDIIKKDDRGKRFRYPKN